MAFFQDCQHVMSILERTYLLAPLESRDMSEEREYKRKRSFVFDMVSATDVFGFKDVLNKWGLLEDFNIVFDSESEAFIIKDMILLPTGANFRFRIVIPVIQDYVCWGQVECIEGW